MEQVEKVNSTEDQTMIYQAQILGKWWAYFPVIITIALITFSMNLMNTGLDQVFNPALRD